MRTSIAHLKDMLIKPHPEYLGFAMRGSYTLLALLVSVLLARLLGAAPLGQYYAVVAWILLVGTIVQSGWAPFLVREVAALHEMERYAELGGLTRAARRMVAAIAVAAAAILVAVPFFMGDSDGSAALFVVGAPIIVLLSTSSIRQAITRGMGRPLLGMICENLTRPGVQVVGLAVLASGLFAVRADPLSAMMVFLVAIASSAMLAFYFERRVLKSAVPSVAPRLPPVSTWVGSFIRTAVIGWSQALNQQVGTLVLSGVSSDVEIAHFRVAQQLSLLLPFGLSIVTTMYANNFSRLYTRGDLGELERLAAKGALISGATAAAIGGVFLIGGRPLIAAIYGAEFAPAFLPLALLIVGQAVNTFFGPGAILSITTRNEGSALKAHVLSAVVNLALCALLAPLWGAAGAAVAAAVSLSTWNIILYLILKRRLGVRIDALTYFRPRRRGEADEASPGQ
jgi:O-antigen/teichoic acid export membrane protein